MYYDVYSKHVKGVILSYQLCHATNTYHSMDAI